MPLRILKWLEDRTGLFGAARAFLKEEIPRSTGWWNTLGSIAGALLLLQIATGFLLALYYVPHLDSAYASVQYVKEEIMAGGLVHALHYWGASFIVAALFIHMIRVFVAGAYKKPRELNWWIGLALFGLVIGLAFTGQLLPWGQEGYWAAKVGVEILSDTPIIGDHLATLFIGGESLGALTLTRFYALHVVLLPAMLGLLVGLHLYLLRRHSPLRPARDTTAETIPFFPNQLAKDLVTISLAFGALLVVALVVQSPESSPADPTDTSYVPRPEWFFLAHYEIFRVTPGAFKQVATFYLPALAGLILFALPWLDRAKTTAFAGRKGLVTTGMVACVAVVALTGYGIATPPDREAAAALAQQEAETETKRAEREDYAKRKSARATYRRMKCSKCHTINRRGGHIGPDLSGVGIRLHEAYIRKWIVNPTAFKPDTVMPPIEASEEEIDLLILYLLSLVDEPDL
ncbi:MAG: cytochrome b N-terminal domain-containing protein [Candidatus Hydrogenedentes bacterium]|nr:cytochrome b N-terminal domain-containing protein [Candidatus Hydrogenedentota bacterium]